jgi:tetratricopeptide (TPR) repeat protein
MLCVYQIRQYLYLIVWLLLYQSSVWAATSSHAERPEESITYWKPFEVLPSEDKKVALADEVFQQLLLGWEETRIAPQLHVVRSDGGPWAASLDDGTVLLSLDAIDICLNDSSLMGRDRVAFVLAHELAHQRADHLWHRRFFRMAGRQPPQVKGRMLGGISFSQLEVADLEAKETQADREGLFMMAMLGFDPYSVVGEGTRFFSEWIESIWGETCRADSPAGDCTKAKSRYERARAHWQEAVQQSVLFDLGVQAYVSGNYSSARKFFQAFGRLFPSREIHNNIGLTHIGEALMLRRALMEHGEDLGPEFVYPYILEDQTGLKKERSRGGSGTRGLVDPTTLKLRQEMERHFNEALLSFDSAIKIDPGFRQSYLNLASTHLLSGNEPQAYGVVAGIYEKRFGPDAMSSLLLGIAAFLAGDTEKARVRLEESVAKATGAVVPLARMDLAEYFGAIGDQENERRIWKDLADYGRRQGDEQIFQLALKRMGKQLSSRSETLRGETEDIDGYRLGQRVPTLSGKSRPFVESEIWVEGERIQIYRIAGGVGMAVDSNQIISALWQGDGSAVTRNGVHIGDDPSRVVRNYGMSNRKIHAMHEDYWLYDNYGIAFLTNRRSVAGWFLYRP